MPYPPINTEISSPQHPPPPLLFNILMTPYPPFANGGIQTMLKHLLYLSYKTELPTNGLQDISFLALKNIKM